MAQVGLVIAAAFTGGALFAWVVVWLFMKGAHCNDDPMDEAEASIPRGVMLDVEDESTHL